MSNDGINLWHILHIDDDKEDYLLTREMLWQSQSVRMQLDWAATYEEGKSMLAEDHFDAVLIDYDLGPVTGIEFIRELSPIYPAPLILYTGRGSREMDLEAMQAGATLYLTKDESNPLLLERAIRYAIDHKRMQADLTRNLQEKSTILESIQDGLFGVDRDWRITYINSRAAQNSGYRPEELVGKNIWEAFPRIKDTILNENYHKAMDERIPVHFEMHSVFQNQWYNISAYPSGTGISIYWQDITNRKRAEEGLRQLSRAVEQSPASVVITDITGKIEYVNPKFTTLTGYSFEEALGQNPSIMKSGQTPPEVYRRLWSSILAGKPWEGELCNRKKNGELYWEFASISPITDEQGTITHFVAVKEDITERKNAEQALREAHDYAAWMARFPDENPNPVARVTFDGTVLYANLPARKLPGWRCEVGKLLPYPLKDMVEHAIAQGDEFQQDVQLLDKYYTISAMPFLQEGYANLYGRDMTERQLAEQALRESEERFNKAFEASPNAIVISRQQDGLIQTVNSAFETLFAYHRDEVIGRRSTDLNMFVRVEDRKEAISQLNKKGIVHDFETEILTKHGEAHSVVLSAAVITVGGETSMVTVITDVTERKQAEEAIRQSMERERARTSELEILMDTVPAMIWISRDSSCRTITGNRFGYEALQMWEGGNISKTASTENLALQPYRNFKNGREIPVDQLPMQLAARTGKPTLNYDYDLVFHDGNVLSVLGNVNPLFDENGKPAGAVAAFMDITDRRKIEEQLKRNAEELERSNQALRDFASIASHDLREPLRKVEAFGHMLVSRYSDALEAEGKDYIARMTSAAKRMSTMLDGLLSYSRVTSQAQAFEPVDLAKVVSEVLSDLEARLLQTGGQVHVCALPVIQADPLQMRQLFQNLLGNALKYHQPGISPIVTISCKTDENRLEIVINDNGIGFDMKDARRLFEPFSRLNKRTEYEGTGMGLAICKKIVERHNGTIEADSYPGKGSTFKVILPTE